MTTSRTIFTGVLLAGLGFAVGCGSKPEAAPNPQQESGPSPATPPSLPDLNAGQPKAELPKVVYEIDQSKHVIPDAPVRGTIYGVEATPTVTMLSDQLTFTVYKDAKKEEVARSLKLKLAPDLVAGQPVPPLLGREWKVKLDAEPGPKVPQVWVDVPGQNPFFAPSGYALTLELGQRKDGKVRGKIYLCLLDDLKTVLAGTFEAEYIRSDLEPPGPDDAPYIAGEVTVTGAQPDTQVRVSYAALTPMGVLLKEYQPRFDPKTERSVRYEHTKLDPGRYLVSAAIIGGPTVWKWLDVSANSALTENFSLDATKSGGVEVTVPASMTGTVLLSPADDPAKPPLSEEAIRAISAMFLRGEVAIIGGKALVKNLAPGKYEVRVGELKGTVDVVAGKTAELTLTPPKKP